LLLSHKGKVNLATIVYLHRITDNRISGSLLKNLKMFTSICGQEAMPNVVVATTMWGEVKLENGNRREEELKASFWKGLLDGGCKVKRFNDTYESAWDVVGRQPVGRAEVQVSHEIVDRHLKLKRTAAGITLHKELKQLLQDRKIAASKLRAQMNSQDNDLVVQQLNQRQAEIDEKITQTANQLKELNIPVFARWLAKLLGGR
jgi:hypothetical protein